MNRLSTDMLVNLPMKTMDLIPQCPSALHSACRLGMMLLLALLVPGVGAGTDLQSSTVMVRAVPIWVMTTGSEGRVMVYAIPGSPVT